MADEETTVADENDPFAKANAFFTGGGTTQTAVEDDTSTQTQTQTQTQQPRQTQQPPAPVTYTPSEGGTGGYRYE